MNPPRKRGGGGCVNETAYAKINLALHVRRRREDGYHELETLFAFVDDGDRLSATLADADALTALGEFAGKIEDPFGNIVAKALAALPHGAGWAVTLEKRLPVAAGLGGGSADAGAVFRMVEAAHGLPDDWHARAAQLGADVPACVLSRPCVGTGTGSDLAEVAENDLGGCPVLLVNPRAPVPTGPVFKAWDRIDRGPMPTGRLRHIALEGRNDLEAPAIAICPVIADVLAALRGTGPFLARMSGSGATCFALYETDADLQAAADKIAVSHPEWWQMAGKLR
ncbi:MAG: 4-(cytidine 5'-diphospho)-2-C-methyl-D-erythritol kinase [Novosphingobium sp.]